MISKWTNLVIGIGEGPNIFQYLSFDILVFQIVSKWTNLVISVGEGANP